MPVDFLTPEQEDSYGRYTGEPSAAELACFFHLDDADAAFILAHRGARNKLGVALQLTTVRYVGTFLEDLTAIPAAVVAHLSAQLSLTPEAADLAGYAAGQAHWEHARAITQRYGYRDFLDQPGYLRFVRWLYARAWTGAERPTVLFEQAVAHLRAAKVLLPGISVLERLVAQVRDRAAARLWRLLAALPSEEQRANLEHLVRASDDQRQTPLDRLRRGPIQATSVTLVAALKRLTEIRALDVGGLDLTHIPQSRLRVLARHAATSRAQALARLPPARRVATLLAFARVLEATAQDDALDVFDQVLDELLRGAARTAKKERLRTLRDLDAAALVLRDVARVVRDQRYRGEEIRDIVAEAHGEGEIDAAIATIDAVARPTTTTTPRSWPTIPPCAASCPPSCARSASLGWPQPVPCWRQWLSSLRWRRHILRIWRRRLWRRCPRLGVSVLGGQAVPSTGKRTRSPSLSTSRRRSGGMICLWRRAGNGRTPESSCCTARRGRRPGPRSAGRSIMPSTPKSSWWP